MQSKPASGQRKFTYTNIVGPLLSLRHTMSGVHFVLLYIKYSGPNNVPLVTVKIVTQKRTQKYENEFVIAQSAQANN